MDTAMRTARAGQRIPTMMILLLAATMADGCGVVPHRLTAHYESPADHLEFQPPCAPEHPVPETGVCRGTGHSTTPTTFTGDWTGRSEYAYAWLALPNGSTLIENLETFTGSIVGCGTGSMTYGMRSVEDQHGNIRAEWEILDGYGTGELERVRGHGTLTGVFRESDLTSSGEFRGSLRCTR
jgi:hypothetical protein